MMMLFDPGLRGLHGTSPPSRAASRSSRSCGSSPASPSARNGPPASRWSPRPGRTGRGRRAAASCNPASAAAPCSPRSSGAVLAATNPIGADQSWRIMFALGALPAFVCLYLRRALEESEQLDDRRSGSSAGPRPTSAADGKGPAGGQRPFTPDGDLPRAGKPPAGAARHRSCRLRPRWAGGRCRAGCRLTRRGWRSRRASRPASGARAWASSTTLGAITAYVISGFVADAMAGAASCC